MCEIALAHAGKGGVDRGAAHHLAITREDVARNHGAGSSPAVLSDGAGHIWPAPDAALPDPKKTRQGREGGVLPNPF